MNYNNQHNDNDDEVRQAAERLRQGSAEAFHILYSRYHNRVYRFCLRMLGNPEAAKDAFQETFIKVYEHRSEFRGNTFAAWLFRICRNCCLNMIRSRKEHEPFDEILHSYDDSQVCDIGLRDQINQAISMLPEQLREAFILREYDDCSYQEIAEILGIELSLAKVRIHRARILLRKILTPLKRELYES